MLTGTRRSRSAGRVLAALTAVAIAGTTVIVGLAGAANADTGAAASPTLTVSPAENLDPSVDNVITITGAGFAGALAHQGMYVNLGAAGTWAPGSVPSQSGWAASGYVPTARIASDGSFTTTLTLAAGTAAPGSTYAAAAFCAHGCSASERGLDAVSGPITFAAAQPTPTATPTATPTVAPEPTPTPSASPSPQPAWTPSLSVFAADGTTPLGGATVRPGDTIVVKGSGFDPAGNLGGRGVPIPATLPQGTYVVFGSAAAVWRPSEGAASSSRKVASQGWVLAESVLDQVPTQMQAAIRPEWVPLADDGTFTARLAVKEPTVVDGGSIGVFTYAAGGVKNAAQELFVPVAYSAAPVAPEPTPEPQQPVGPTLVVSPATALDPGVDQRFTITGSGFTGALSHDGLYVNIGPASAWTPGTTPSQSGWTASDYLPKARIAADGTFSTTLTVKAGAARSGSSYVAAVFCAHGCSGYDRSLDAVSGPITFAAASPGGLLPAPAPAPTSAPVLAVEGVRAGGSVTAGESVTIVASGFRPNETGIRLELHSDPVVLATGLTADASGTVRTTVTLPSGTPAGNHHLVVIGADGRQVSFPVAVAAALPVCVARVVSGATLSWGVKGDFREYVTGSIAHGSATGTGVAGSGPWTWSGGNGTFNTNDGVGRAAFAGSVRFTGHGGVLDVTISNPRVQVNGSTSATLVADVRTAEKSYPGIAVATLRLADGTASRAGDKVSWQGLPATLTATAAPAFEGFYSAGAALDPVSFTLPLGAETDCTSASGATLAKYGKGGVLAATGGDLDALSYALLLVTFGGAMVLVARRRAQAAKPVPARR
ncbi:HtaA domain-containing protein [Cellulomonas chengniuliangii]|nr:HtaA domain-containing protein [Cellulomonas chengniuliangii]